MFWGNAPSSGGPHGPDFDSSAPRGCLPAPGRIFPPQPSPDHHNLEHYSSSGFPGSDSNSPINQGSTNMPPSGGIHGRCANQDFPMHNNFDAHNDEDEPNTNPPADMPLKSAPSPGSWPTHGPPPGAFPPPGFNYGIPPVAGGGFPAVPPMQESGRNDFNPNSGRPAHSVGPHGQNVGGNMNVAPNNMMSPSHRQSGAEAVSGGPQPGQVVSSASQQHQAVINMMGFLASMPGFNIPGMPGMKFNHADAPDPSIPSNKTLYVNNLNGKIKTDQLQKELRAMFTNFGKILDIVAMKSFWRRGQAWIIFAEQDAATKALRGLQGFEYHGKSMRLNYAHERSDIFTKQDGSFTERAKGPRRPRAIVMREMRLQQQIQQMVRSQSQQQQQQQQQPRSHPLEDGHSLAGARPVAAGDEEVDMSTKTAFGQRDVLNNLLQKIPGTRVPPPPSSAAPPMAGAGVQQDKAAVVAAAAAQAAEAMEMAKRKRMTDTPVTPVGATTTSNQIGSSAQGTAAAMPPGLFIPPFDLSMLPHNVTFQPALPNETLFVENLPETCTEATLQTLFKRYAGFIELRLIAARKVAFVEYETDGMAGAAMNGLQNFEPSPGKPLRISYAKR